MSRAVSAMRWGDGNRHRGSVPNPRDSGRVHYRAAGGRGVSPLLLLMLVVLVLLAGCGGGDDGPSRPGTRIGEAGPEPGAPAVGAPGMESGPASVWAAAVVGRADALFATSAHEESGFGARDVHDVGCSGLSCSGPGRGGVGLAMPGGSRVPALSRGRAPSTWFRLRTATRRAGAAGCATAASACCWNARAWAGSFGSFATDWRSGD